MNSVAAPHNEIFIRRGMRQGTWQKPRRISARVKNRNPTVPCWLSLMSAALVTELAASEPLATPSIPPSSSSSYSSFYSIFLRPPPLASLLNWLGFLSTQTLSVLLFSTTTFLFSSTCGSRGFEIKQAKQAKQNNTEKANKSHLSCSETYLQAAHYVQQIDNVMGIVFFF